MEKLEFEKSWNYSNEDVTDNYLQNAWNQTLHGVLNEIKGSSLNSEDTIYVSYVLKDFINTIMWLDKPIIKYRYDNEHSIYFNNGRIRIENYPYNHQENEEWIESQKNVFFNLDKQVKGMYPEIWNSKDSIYKYLDYRYSSGRKIVDGDVIYSGIIYNFITNQNNLYHFNITELNDDNNIYEYFDNDDNNGLLPKLTFKTAWKAKCNLVDLPIKLNEIVYRISLEINKETKFTVLIPADLDINQNDIQNEFNSEINIVVNKDVTKKNNVFIYSNYLDLNNFNYKLCGKVELYG